MLLQSLFKNLQIYVVRNYAKYGSEKLYEKMLF